MKTAGSVSRPAVLFSPRRKDRRRYHACLAVPAASVTTAAMKPATTAVKAAATAMETTAATAVETTSTAEAAAMKPATVKVTTAEAVIKATATVEAATKATTTVKAATKETISVPEAKATPETEPRACADENAALKPVRAVIAVGRAGVWVIVVIAIGADRRCAVIDRASKSNAEADALGVRIRSREETNTEKKTE
jgi:hypothetical protein